MDYEQQIAECSMNIQSLLDWGNNVYAPQVEACTSALDMVQLKEQKRLKDIEFSNWMSAKLTFESLAGKTAHNTINI